MKGRDVFRRYGLELLAVFLGVWLSLIAEGWRQGQIEARQERASLSRLAEDLRLDILLFEDTEAETARHESALWLRQNIRRDDLPEDSVAAALRDILSSTSDIGTNSEYTALKTSGNLGLLSDPDLRVALSRYYEDQPYLRVIEERQYDAMMVLLDLVSEATVFYEPGDLNSPSTPSLLPGWREVLRQPLVINYLRRNEHLTGWSLELKGGYVADARWFVEKIEQQIQ
ncbi:hypothetical protein ACFL5A_01995 [Gemmatimonadota bacterium]